MAFRSTCVHNLKSHEREREADFHTPTKRDENILKMQQAIETKNMTVLPTSGLWNLLEGNLLEGNEATPQQAHGLLNFREIGQDSFDRYVSTKIIGA